MEDDDGIELSLGLSCRGSSAKAKMRDDPPDPRTEEENCNVNANVSGISFTNFFRDKQEEADKQKSDTDLRTPEKFWTNLGSDGSIDAQGHVSQFIRCEGLWGSNARSAENEDISVPTKRKLPFEDVGSQQHQNRAADVADSLSKNNACNTAAKHSRISTTTEDCSTGENEEVAESEVEELNTWLIAPHDDNKKGVETYDFTDKQAVISKLSRKLPIVQGNESIQEQGKAAEYGIPLSLHPLPAMSIPYPLPLKAPSLATAPNAAILSSPCVMQLMPTGNKERPVLPNMKSDSSQYAFGYSSMQLPTLESGPTWAFGCQTHCMASFPFSGHSDGVPNLERFGNLAPISHASVLTPHSSMSELINGGRKHNGDVGNSNTSLAGECTAIAPKELACQPLVDGLAQRYPVIRPGLASHVNFGGSGSYPDLPWVSATGPGPHGRTISGVTYKYKEDQVKIVCSCHGTHMTPDEFVHHASEDAPNHDDTAVLTSLPSNKPAASAQI